MKKQHNELTYSELVALLASRQAERDAAIVRIKDAMEQYAITVADLGATVEAATTTKRAYKPRAKSKTKRVFKSTPAQRKAWRDHAARQREKKATLLAA